MVYSNDTPLRLLIIDKEFVNPSIFCLSLASEVPATIFPFESVAIGSVDVKPSIIKSGTYTVFADVPVI